MEALRCRRGRGPARRRCRRCPGAEGPRRRRRQGSPAGGGQQFESLMVAQMLKTMRETRFSEEDDPMTGGEGIKLYREPARPAMGRQNGQGARPGLRGHDGQAPGKRRAGHSRPKRSTAASRCPVRRRCAETRSIGAATSTASARFGHAGRRRRSPWPGHPGQNAPADTVPRAGPQAAFLESMLLSCRSGGSRHRRAGPLHPGPGGSGIRLGRARNQGRRGPVQPQPVRHQGRPQLGRRIGGGHHHRIPPGPLHEADPAFRAYADYGAAFTDYANLLRNRYGEALRAGDDDGDVFALGLADGGYATDPAYAGKLKAVIASVAMAGS
jgi:hypothetical protein